MLRHGQCTGSHESARKDKLPTSGRQHHTKFTTKSVHKSKHNYLSLHNIDYWWNMSFIKRADYELSNYRSRIDIARPSGEKSFTLPPLITPGAAEDSNTADLTRKMTGPSASELVSNNGWEPQLDNLRSLIESQRQIAQQQHGWRRTCHVGLIEE